MYNYPPHQPYGQQPPQYDPRYQQPYGYGQQQQYGYDPRYGQQQQYGYNSPYGQQQPYGYGYNRQPPRVGKLDHTMLGRCFVDTTDTAASPDVRILRRNLQNQLQLASYSKKLSRPVPLTAEQNTAKWLDVTSAVKKLELLSWHTINSQIHNMKPASSMVGRLALIHNEHGQLYREVFLIADYVQGQAFLLSLKDFRAFNWKVDQVIDFSEMMMDVLMRADDRNPLKSSAFDSFWRLLSGNSLGNYVRGVLNKFGSQEGQTACVQLMNIFLKNGLPINQFDELVEDIYKELPTAAQQLLDKNHVIAVYQALQEGLLAETLLNKYKLKYAGAEQYSPDELVFASGICKIVGCKHGEVPKYVKIILNSAPHELRKNAKGNSELEIAYNLADAYMNKWQVTPIEEVPVVSAEDAASRFHETPAVPMQEPGTEHSVYPKLRAYGVKGGDYESIIDAIVKYDNGMTTGSRLDIAFLRADDYFNHALDAPSYPMSPEQLAEKADQLAAEIQADTGMRLMTREEMEENADALYEEARRVAEEASRRGEHPIYQVLRDHGIEERDFDSTIAKIVRCTPPQKQKDNDLDTAYNNWQAYFADQDATALDPCEFVIDNRYMSHEVYSLLRLRAYHSCVWATEIRRRLTDAPPGLSYKEQLDYVAEKLRTEPISEELAETRREYFKDAEKDYRAWTEELPADKPRKSTLLEKVEESLGIPTESQAVRENAQFQEQQARDLERQDKEESRRSMTSQELFDDIAREESEAFDKAAKEAYDRSLGGMIHNKVKDLLDKP